MTGHLPTVMKSLVWTGPRQMEMQEMPLPVPGDDEVLLEVATVGICGSELSGYLGHNSLRKPPLVMGHEFSASIAQVGGGALADGSLPAPSQRVAVNPLVNCGACILCENSLPNLCLRRQIIGAHRPGAFARYVVAPAAQCWPLPDSMSDIAGALAEPLACAVRAVFHAQWHGNGPLLILGAGAIGLCCLAMARTQNAGDIVVSDRTPARLRLAQSWGATALIDASAADAQQQMRAALPDGPVSVIDAVGSNTTRALALQLVRPGGRIVYIGLHDETSPLAANYLVRQEVTIQGSFAYTPADFAHAFALLAASIVAPSPTWIEERPLSAGASAFAGLVDGAISIPKIVLRPD
jgi:threonine dehydrogenase-like Zn-dependent dehydrogenase